jgi:hypothetical protein
MAMIFLLINHIAPIEDRILGMLTLFIFILIALWLMLWTNYFLTKAENFKKLIESMDK